MGSEWPILSHLFCTNYIYLSKTKYFSTRFRSAHPVFSFYLRDLFISTVVYVDLDMHMYIFFIHYIID